MEKLAQGMFIALVIVFNIVIGAVSNELGVTQTTDLCGAVTLGAPCYDAPSQPSDGGIFDKIIAPLKYAWDAAATFFKIVTWQVDGISPFVAVLILIPDIIALVVIYSMIRGN